MKKSIRSILYSCALLLGVMPNDASAQHTNNFTIHGVLKDMQKMPSKMYVIYDRMYKQAPDSGVVTNGRYIISGYTGDVAGATLSAVNPVDHKKDKSFGSIILDEGDLNVVSTGTVCEMTVTGSGSASHNQFQSLLTANKKEAEELNDLRAGERFKTDSAFRKSIKVRYSGLAYKSLNDMAVFVRTHPQAAISPYLTYCLIGLGILRPAVQDSLVNALPPAKEKSRLRFVLDSTFSARKAHAAKMTAARAAAQAAADEKTPIGSQAKDFTQPDINGVPVSLTSFRGRYVLIDFWASWCAPCRAENPNVVQAYQKYKEKGFAIVSVSLDAQSQKDAWLAAIKKDGLTWTQVSDLTGWKNKVVQMYGVRSIPQNFLIDPKGVIVAKNLRGEALTKKLASLLN